MNLLLSSKFNNRKLKGFFQINDDESLFKLIFKINEVDLLEI